MMQLQVPVIAIVMGEGGSGGALAIGVCDELAMLSNALYSVISPRGFASLLWKDPTREREAADILQITADRPAAPGHLRRDHRGAGGGRPHQSVGDGRSAARLSAGCPAAPAWPRPRTSAWTTAMRNSAGSAALLERQAN